MAPFSATLASSQETVWDCPGTAAITIAPPNATLSPLSTLGFSASGGNAVYIYSISVNNSGGIINASSGLYRAGSVGNVTDTVRVTDGLGAFFEAPVTVTDNLGITPNLIVDVPGATTSFTASGGDAFYTYSLFVNGNNTNIVAGKISKTWSTIKLGFSLIISAF